MTADTAGSDEEPMDEELDEELDDEELDDDDLEDLEDDDEDDEDDEDLDDDEDDEDEYEPGDVNAVASDYEAGDVNTVDAAAPRGGGRRPAAEPSEPDGGTPLAVLTYLAESMADDPGAVVIRQEERRGSSVLRLHVAPQDMGRVIGRRGRTAQAIRTLVAAAGARDGVQVAVDIVDD